ncbi:MAG: nucleotide sugar dehydrogenase, partial [Mesorhizobium sp.]
MQTAPDLQELVNRIRTRDYTIGIMGLGYVGLPLAMISLDVGFKVIGFDIDASRVALLNRGETGIDHLPGAA